MKTAIIAVVVLAVLGGAGYGIYRWTDAPERAEAWMAEQDLKNFPAQARRDVKKMKSNLEAKKKVKKDLEKDIIAREGRESWDDAVLKSETKGLATALWYAKLITKHEEAIGDIVRQVKEERTSLNSAGTVDADTGKIPADHEYSITSANGKELKWTQARARKETDKFARNIATYKRKKALQERVINKKKEYVKKLDTLTVKLGEKIEQMEVFIEEMEVELELLDLEKDISEVNASLNGESDNSKFGKSIRLFRAKQKEFLAEQELAGDTATPDEGYFKEEGTEVKEEGASASYWN